MKKVMSSLKSSMAVCAVIVGLCVSVQGELITEVIDQAYIGVEAGGNVGISLNGNTGYSGANGLMAFQTKNAVGTLAAQIPAKAWGYCIELDQHTDFSFAQHNVAPLSSVLTANKAALIGQLWAQHYNSAWQSSTYIYYGGNQGGWVSGQPANTTENQQATALCYAIYEITYDFNSTISSLNLNSGSLKATSSNPSSSVALAQGWLAALTLPSAYAGPVANLAVMTHATRQNIIVEIPGTVPEPATMLLLGLGSLVFVKRR